MGVNTALEIVLYLLLICAAIYGAKKGLILSLVSTFGLGISLIASAVLSEALAAPIAELLHPLLKEPIESMLHSNSYAYELTQKAMERSDYGEAAGKALNATSKATSTLSQVSSETVLEMIVHAILFLILYLLTLYAIKEASVFVEKIFKLPLINLVNWAGGALFGAVAAYLILFSVMYLCGLFGFTFFADNAEGTHLLLLLTTATPNTLLGDTLSMLKGAGIDVESLSKAKK